MPDLQDVFYDEVSTCAGHTHHGAGCNCARTVSSLLHRMRTDPAMVRAWLDAEGLTAHNFGMGIKQFLPPHPEPGKP